MPTRRCARGRAARFRAEIRGGLIALGIAAVVACGAPPRSPGVAAGRVDIPYPDLSGLDESVRTELTDTRAALEAALARDDADAGALAAVYGEAGMTYHAYGLRDAASACHENAARLDERDHRWPYYLAQLARTRGELDRAATLYRRVLELRSDDVPTLIHLGSVELERNAPDDAEPAFARALEIDARSARALIGLGKVAAARGQHDVAVERFEAALAISPEASEIHYPLGLAYRALGDLDRARDAVERRGKKRAPLADPLMQAVRGREASWRLHQNRGTALFQEGFYDRALAEFLAAFEAAPEQAIVHVNLGSTYTRLGDVAAANREFEQALRIEPQNVMALFNLGTLAAGAGDDASAVERYTAALAVDPDALNVHFNMANALRRLGRFEESVPHYRRVVEEDPRNVSARLGEVLSLVRLRRDDEALARIERAHLVVRDDPNVRHTLVRLLATAPDAALRDGPRALELARALTAEERSANHVVALAMAAAAAGEFGAAVEAQRGVIVALERAGRTERLVKLRADLARYERGEPCTRPWADDDRLLNPRPLDVAGIRRTKRGQ